MYKLPCINRFAIYLSARKIFWVLLFVFLALHIWTYSQKLLPDTVFINFRADSLLILSDIGVSKVIDSRGEDPRFVRYLTTKKYLLIPVDREVYTHSPLSEEIVRNIPNVGKRIYEFNILKFQIEVQKGRFGATTVLSADIGVYSKMGDSAKYLGTYFYDYPYFPSKKKEPLLMATQNHLAAWHTQFKLDLMMLPAGGVGISGAPTGSFISKQGVKSVYLNVLTSAMAGFNWWGFEGQIFFTRPEIQKENKYKGGLIRYLNHTDYQSIAIGQKAGNLYYRLSDKWVLNTDLNILLGFCKWKELEKTNPKLYQLFDFELSSVQSLIYSPKNAQNFLFRIGIIESLNYVIDRRLLFLGGITLGTGYKF